MDFKINENNLDQWCFDYVENLLNKEDRLFFEQALEFDENIRLEYSKWEQTVIQDLSSVVVNPSLKKDVLKAHKKSNTTKWIVLSTIISLLVIVLYQSFSYQEPFTNKEYLKIDTNEAPLSIIIAKAKSPETVTKVDTKISSRKKNHIKSIIPVFTSDTTGVFIKQILEDTVFEDLSKNQVTEGLDYDSVKNLEVLIPRIEETRPIQDTIVTKKKKRKRKKIIIIHDQL